MLKQFATIRRSPLEYLGSAWREHGDVVQFPIPSPPSYFINHPTATRGVLVADSHSYGKATIQYRSLSLVTGEGLLTADTPAWRRQRPLVQPAFHHETLAHIVDHVGIAARRLIDAWTRRPAGMTVDMDQAMMNAALEVVGNALFGTDLSEDADRLTQATLAALDIVIARARPSIPPPKWLPTKSNRTLHRSVSELDSAVDHLLQSRRTSSRATGRDMIDLLLAARDDAGEGLTPNEIRNQVVTFIVAGHETVASALTWSWALLAAHPEMQARLQEESDTVLGGRAATFDDIPNLPVARAVFDETLRLYPPAWLITRNALVDAELGGYLVPTGSLIILSPWWLHRHPELWPDPERFDPDRFLSGDAARHGFIPFGAGLRQCIGKDFAYTEGVLMLSTLAGSIDVAYPPGGGVPAVEPLVTVRPVGGLPLTVRPR